jgi:sugar lactone lactonase YvrE
LEGPSYDEDASEASFIDINDQLLYTFDPAKGPESLKKIKTHDTLGYVHDPYSSIKTENIV